jgi:hypothetical protein
MTARRSGDRELLCGALGELDERVAGFFDFIAVRYFEDDRTN